MNRRSFVRLLGLAPTAAILPLAGIATAVAKQAAETAGPTIIDGGRIISGSIRADQIAATSICASKIDVGTITAGQLKRTSIDQDGQSLTA
ncbi:hypothetical protein [Methylorubrum sp. POS3]|uniref:hypothetical protein n=1 Tax=Methylorubrum sp. POS3 TaxID=2998492 RepID=UPI00372BD4A3